LSDAEPTTTSPVNETGLPIVESVRFTVAGLTVCRVGFTVLGRRAEQAPARERAAVGAAARHLGATLAVWTSLAPDAKGLVALAESERLAMSDAELAAALEQGSLLPVAAGLLVAVRSAVGDVIATCGQADGRLQTGLRIIEVHLRHAASCLHADGERSAGDHAGEVVRVSTAALSLLVGARKHFSSPLTVPKSVASNHPTW
jgi:predicted component of type VI protein secretion system